MGAVQAQEYGPAKWGLALRSAPAVTDRAIERAVERGRILRTHILRPTWHFVLPQDIRWMLELTAPQVHRRMAPYDRQLGLDARVKVRAAAVFERALRDGDHLARAELGAHLERARLPSRGFHLAHLAMYAELEGLITSGPRRGKQFTYALLADRAPRARALPRDEALAALARRFFQSHGPATIRDYTWWSGLAAADAKRGLEMIGARATQGDGVTYWTLGDPPSGAVRTRLYLLPIYDEYLVAYRDRQVVPHAPYTFGNVGHALVVHGQVAGTWRVRETGPGLAFEVRLLRPLRRSERRALAVAAARYGRFVARPVASIAAGRA
jgi:hypothetical protein